jgi:DNA-directed RNA polymerase beta subunit
MRSARIESVRVYESRTRPGCRSTEVVLCEMRAPVIGDKLSSRHGQKGTIGRVLCAEDMPFDAATGMAPDLIINPHAYTSRMTIAQVMESAMGVFATEQTAGGGLRQQRGGEEDDVDEVDEEDEEAVRRLARDGTTFSAKRGWTPDGKFCGKINRKVRVINGTTGEMLDQPVEMGLVYYMRLGHMASDKVHARSTGRRDANRQPTEGMKNYGGLRFGEMERDATIAHGAALFARDRLLDCSDSTVLPICGECGSIAQMAAPRPNDLMGPVRVVQCTLNSKPFCRVCRSGNNVNNVAMPYAMKVLAEELSACHFLVEFETKPIIG